MELKVLNNVVKTTSSTLITCPCFVCKKSFNLPNLSSRNLDCDSKALDENISVRQRVLKLFQVWLHSDQMTE
ncbi:hypothetical protein OSB04_005638 [Centaurea solstitialis]|uniref:Uncharacterized protein n=1 Tax=Centaurea solstitialis TaxID=347529 RepID=A0AA38TP24_9ASTR|nr:hypothetical protein OSB04_005638 [Centaurea solstitialis]